MALLLVLLLVPGIARGSGRVEKAVAAYADGELGKALTLLRGVGTAEAALLRGRALLELKRHTRAATALRGLVRRLPHLRDLVRYLQGEALFGQRRYVAAAARFRAAARAKNSRWVDQAWQRQADALRRGRRYGAAVKAYDHLLRVYPDHPERSTLELHLARCLWRAGKARDAAVRLREIIYRWPTEPAAARAEQSLERLLRRGRVKLPPTPFARRLQRARALRWGKLYDRALEELRQLGSLARSPEEKTARALEAMRLHLKRDKPEAAVAAFKATFLDRPPHRAARRNLADALARLGRLDEALEVLAGRAQTPRGWRGRMKEDEERMIRLLREHARYKQAMKRVRAQLERLPEKERKKRLLGWAWLAYRAGELDLAIEGFQHLNKHSAGDRDFALYWEARAQAKAGRPKEAEALYRQLLEKYLRTYYGLQARSRLVEMGKLTLSNGASCDEVTPEGPGATGDPLVPELIDRLIRRHADLYPSLLRAKTLWKLGMMEDARRELRLIAIDFAWIQAHGRPRWYIHRPSVERIWRGAKPERRRWTRRAREIYKVRGSLAPAIGELMEHSGIFFYGWKFLPKSSDPAKHWHPRAHRREVLRIAHRFQLDPNLLWSIMKTESSFRTDVVSRAGAIGLMQIMPVTARRLAREMKLESFDPHQLFVPEVNLAMAGHYLRAVSNKFRGQPTIIAAAYNGGPHNVARWLDQRGRSTDLDEFIEEIPFTESRRYAKKILRLVALYERIYCNKDDRVTTNVLDLRYGAHPDY